MTRRVGASFLIYVLIVLALGHGSPATAQQTVKNPDTIVTLRTSDPRTLDPAAAYDETSQEVVYPNVYETLIMYAGSNLSIFVPVLATQVPSLANGLISKDGLAYTFPIRKGVKFHDGSVMTPEDVRYSILRFMLQDIDGGPSWLLLGPLLGKDSTREHGKLAVTYDEAARAVTTQGDAVIFHLKKPFAPFLSIVAAWSFVMPKAWAVKNGDWDGSPSTWQKYNNPKVQDRYAFDHMNGTGPFRLQQWDRQGKTIALARNEAYWRKPARVARVVIRAVPEFTTRRLQLQQGDADFIAVNRPEQSQVAGLQGVTTRDDLPGLDLLAFHFNEKINPEANPDIGSGTLDGNGIPSDFFSDVHVRRAFAYAFDYATFIRDGYRGKAVQPNGPIVQGLLGYDPAAPKCPFDRDKAVAEFKEAWGGRVWTTGFKFTETYSSGNTTMQIGTQVLRDVVQSLSPKFKVETRNVDGPALFQLLVARKGTVFARLWGPDYPDPDNFAGPFLASNSVYPKRTGYQNAEADRLVQEAAVTSDPVKRGALYRQLTRIAYNDAPAIYAAQETTFRVMRSWIHGWYYNMVFPLDYYPLSKE